MSKRLRQRSRFVSAICTAFISAFVVIGSLIGSVRFSPATETHGLHNRNRFLQWIPIPEKFAWHFYAKRCDFLIIINIILAGTYANVTSVVLSTKINTYKMPRILDRSYFACTCITRAAASFFLLKERGGHDRTKNQGNCPISGVRSFRNNGSGDVL
jgi:hypothetical protein